MQSTMTQTFNEIAENVHNTAKVMIRVNKTGSRLCNCRATNGNSMTG